MKKEEYAIQRLNEIAWGVRLKNNSRAEKAKDAVRPTAKDIERELAAGKLTINAERLLKYECEDLLSGTLISEWKERTALIEKERAAIHDKVKVMENRARDAIMFSDCPAIAAILSNFERDINKLV